MHDPQYQESVLPQGDITVVPHDRHGLRAEQDSAVLLTTAIV